MITPSETQLISFRICLSQLESAPQNEQVPNIYPRFTEVIESVRNLEIPESVNNEMSSTKYRPRIRLLTRLRSESSRKVDTSKPGEDEITIALGDSVFHSANIISFYAHM
uniref:Uncharacterized protein n=1 Tax=Caenorhabditis japonica TaxID=281687 RepID=A0A8R1J0N2_CAEJA